MLLQFINFSDRIVALKKVQQITIRALFIVHMS